jgi:hypothetical protein
MIVSAGSFTSTRELHDRNRVFGPYALRARTTKPSAESRCSSLAAPTSAAVPYCHLEAAVHCPHLRAGHWARQVVYLHAWDHLAGPRLRLDEVDETTGSQNSEFETRNAWVRLRCRFGFMEPSSGT